MRLIESLKQKNQDLDESIFPALFFLTENETNDNDAYPIRAELKFASSIYKSDSVEFVKFYKNICQY